MKNVAVVCNNLTEWKYFVDSMQWNLSKQNLPYRETEMYIQDLSSGMEFIHIPNNVYKLSQILYMTDNGGLSIDLIVPMCKMDEGVEDYLRLFMEGVRWQHY